ncbi:hypothetical protein, partial [Paraburkholderia podalyriae]|uniref:hypothetical protein n=1 Tax=Paraburkholderia podalyriae TaxID=1938811 RepID=UPI001CA42A75
CPIRRRMRHTSRRCQRSNWQLDDPGASTYKLDLTVRTNGATSKGELVTTGFDLCDRTSVAERRGKIL